VELKELYGNQKHLIAKNGLIYRNDKGNSQLFVPKCKRQTLIETAHETSHQSADKLYAAPRQRYWWPSMRRDIKQYCAACIKCIQGRPSPSKRTTPLQLFQASARFELVHIDVMGGHSFATTKTGKQYILVIIDLFTRYCVAVPLKTKRRKRSPKLSCNTGFIALVFQCGYTVTKVQTSKARFSQRYVKDCT
jgi:hypothetical protein